MQTGSRQLADSIRQTLSRSGIRATLVGPHPCPITRLRDAYRYDLQITFPTADAMLRAIDLFKSEGTLKAATRNLVVDVDPISLQ